MPSRPAKKFNARFPPARIKKIMQADEQIGKVAAAVPIIVSRSLESFAELLLKRINDVTTSKNAKTVTPSHIKQVIMGDGRFKFLCKYVEEVPESAVDMDSENSAHSSSSEEACGAAYPVPVYSGDGAVSVSVSGRSLAEICLMTGVTNHQ